MQHTLVDGKERIQLTRREKSKYQECQLLTDILARFYPKAEPLAAAFGEFMKLVDENGRLKIE